LRILLVEDEESLRITLAANLELEGHEVIEANDGRHAVELLNGTTVDLALSDIRMPRLGGLGLLQFMKREHPLVPVALMTAYAFEDQIDLAILEGALTVLRKPFDLGATMASLTRAARGTQVLIVDDDHVRAGMLVEEFRRVGLRAEAVPGGDAATDLVADGHVDVCVANLALTDTDGAGLFARLREIEGSIAFIAFSGDESDDLSQRASIADVVACLGPPVSPSEVLRTVAKARGGQWAL
jgi:DNA-binding NtrC family response regulator